MAVNLNLLPTRLMLGKIAVELGALGMSTFTGSFFLKTESRHSTHIRHKLCKFGWARSIMKDDVLQKMCTVSALPGLPSEEVSLKSTRGTYAWQLRAL